MSKHDPIDTSILPPAVRLAAERANQLQRDAIAAAQAPVEPLQAPAGNEPEQPQEQRPDPTQPQDRGFGHQPQAQTIEPRLQAPPEPGQGEPERQEPPQDNQPERERVEHGSLEHRLQSAEGRLRALNDDNNNLRRIIAQMENTPAAPAADAQRAAEIAVEALTDEEKADYGPDLLKVMEKVAGGQIARMQAEHKRELDALRAQVTGVANVTAQTATERMYSTLDTRVPDWRQVNVDPGFVDWLQYADNYSGQPRIDLLQKAYAQQDAARVAAFFEGYAREAAPSAPRTTAPVPSNGRAPAPAKTSLDAYVAPGKARQSAPAPAADDKPLISRAQIKQFYTDVQHGAYRGKDGERNRIEKMIFDATAEGRVA